MQDGGCQRLQFFGSHLPFKYALHGSFLTAGVELDRADLDLPLEGLIPLLLPYEERELWREAEREDR